MKVLKKDYGKSPDYVRRSAELGRGLPPVVWEAVEDSPFFLDHAKRPRIIRAANLWIEKSGAKMWHTGESLTNRGFVTIACRWTFMERKDARRFRQAFNSMLALHEVPE